jgi:hypothetical protein
MNLANYLYKLLQEKYTVTKKQKQGNNLKTLHWSTWIWPNKQFFNSHTHILNCSESSLRKQLFQTLFDGDKKITSYI